MSLILTQEQITKALLLEADFIARPLKDNRVDLTPLSEKARKIFYGNNPDWDSFNAEGKFRDLQYQISWWYKNYDCKVVAI